MKYDVIVIGGGSGGLTVASGAARFGAKTALIEKEAQLGGDCLHYGCVPSKALIAASREVHDARQAAKRFGISVTGKPDWKKVTGSIQQAVDTIQEHDSHERFEREGIDVYTGEASFAGKNRIDLKDGPSLEGEKIVIATGSSPAILPIEGIEQIRVLTNESVFYTNQFPERVVMVGGGPIGLEMAQALSRLGSEVTVLENSDHLLIKEDREIAARAVTSLQKELRILTGTRASKVYREGNKTFVETEGRHSENIEADALFVAAGRKPNTKSLHVQRAGLSLTKGGAVKVNDKLQTEVAHIYAVGDVNGRFPFTHGAGEEGKTVIANALFGLRRKISYDDMPWCFYTDPEIFHLGLTEDEAAQETGGDYDVYRGSGADRMIAEGDEDSFVKVITKRDGTILGAHGLGRNASDWMQTMVLMKAKGHPLKDLSSITHPYPARTEIVKQTSDAWWTKKLFQSPLTGLSKKALKAKRSFKTKHS
ncbi:dihydrolipoyl dehydrogenase family protein [Alkalicoccus luteus]|uniref:NAD(P)/FAD-dependent oxidoreductase n=1 Tax=Alkalicoccus luteus TaxID=1237094 RepID=A0A969PVZ1_9BACI|nr:NAD(P)/FAD-dependent oxidoreductase [Alkalicoccus luteus]NJP36647.1 NAD(P)/FAD-dependent oxidoreductase [Alkalicoccus luteus]